MTAQDKYKAEQEACGIEVGDTVKAVQHFDIDEGGSCLASSKGSKKAFIDDDVTGPVTSISQSGVTVDCGSRYLGQWLFPYFVLQITKKGDGSVPEKVNKHGERTSMTSDEFFDMRDKLKKTQVEIADKCMELINTNFTGECTMKTQELYNVVVTENENVKDAKTGQIESVKKKVIFADPALAAYNENNAHTKALAAVFKGEAGSIKDIDEVEVLVRPFTA